MVQFNFQAPWVPILNNCVSNELAATDNNPPFTTFQLATIDSKTGYPQNRTLIYRGWLFNNKSSNVITFTTDKRMEKYQELLDSDKVEAVFWFGHIRKQIRFRGKVRLLDSEHQPSIDLNHITSGEVTPIELDSNEDDSRARVQKQPVQTSLISPSFVENDNTQEDLSTYQYAPPTREEWQQELDRQWNGLSKALKTSFRKPDPKSPMTEDKAKLISKIQRGVDGKKEEDGYKNFAVGTIFVNYVDYYEQDKDKRFVYELDEESHTWTEEEVCP
ncbi:Pyridoxamine 5'-phosphate oxidase family protein [Candida parapsilosis]|uniref:Pyridox_oxase_2 domain-containing protein n=2 Tax=Candida parapsilosis TaxID=5480 RepID=G8BKY5_CANPC|nr:uncharacterized protein CPAR2_704150 [Candida parapsilosis]KAF6042020.1 Pyridoxamine 5'-phosphate oxidase family protein [Candida parapsilosis]KAF6042299.1 Pyridoxamine 5'-phosphate oxidase family protein [Candida parapsilosis]KAF6042744.1 Pyridoxamine 5'-phosphate oxidase family protein [Candida parapsilosis]KAF6058247.1 Pyridoxamine 5'-phosphate oxidase family protein [Candida parapsilosis]KAI5904169.1 hypothetical protein K4G60_g3327 [Candida parapsilosis]